MTGQRADANDQRPSRRLVLKGIALGGAAVPLLTACGGDDEPSTTSTPQNPKTSARQTTPQSDTPSASSRPDKDKPSRQSTPLIKAAAVPVGGGVILGKEGVVVTQPSKGEFRGFSSTCTHMGCPLAEVSGGSINCDCHGSMFSIKDGSVVGGPAPQPLPDKPVVVADGQVALAE